MIVEHYTNYYYSYYKIIINNSSKKTGLVMQIDTRPNKFFSQNYKKDYYLNNDSIYCKLIFFSKHYSAYMGRQYIFFRFNHNKKTIIF